VARGVYSGQGNSSADDINNLLEILQQKHTSFLGLKKKHIGEKFEKNGPVLPDPDQGSQNPNQDDKNYTFFKLSVFKQVL
jgi:hypothetical protein